MLSKSTLIALLSLTFCFIGCAAKPDVRIDPSWMDAPQSVSVEISEPLVEILNDVKDDLPDAAGHFGEWFSVELQKEMAARTKADVQVSLKEDSYFKTSRDTLNNKTISYPSANFSNTRDITLLINPIKVHRYEESTKMYNGMGMNSAAGGTYTSTQSYLAFDLVYAYYDTKTKKLLGFGSVMAKDNFMVAMTKSNWIATVKDAVNLLLKGTPLLKK